MYFNLGKLIFTTFTQRKGCGGMFQILVVEDDASLRKLMSAALKQHGYSCHTANDGVEALDVMEKTNIDLIISDVMMPNMDGYELTRQLRRAKYDLPILMVTAKETFEDKQEGFIAGTDDYMVKPIDINEMVLRVGALLRRSKMASEHWSWATRCLITMRRRSASARARRRYPQKSLCCCSSCFLIQTRYSPDVSCLTSFGAWRRKSMRERSMFI